MQPPHDLVPVRMGGALVSPAGSVDMDLPRPPTYGTRRERGDEDVQRDHHHDDVGRAGQARQLRCRDQRGDAHARVPRHGELRRPVLSIHRNAK
jgi:hypothetical protein